MALCNVTGTLYLPNGLRASDYSIFLHRVDKRVVADYQGSVIPQVVRVLTSQTGTVNFQILTGRYVGIARPSNAPAKSTGYEFKFGVPDEATANFESCIDAIHHTDTTPPWLARAEAAASAAEQAAQEAQDALSEATFSYETRADMVADLAALEDSPEGRVIYAGGIAYQRAEGAETLTDMPDWLPVVDGGGAVPVEAWGVLYNDRSAAQGNGEAINEALRWCADNKVKLYLGRGTIFNSVPITQPGPVHVFGAGPVGEWSKWMTAAQGRAATTIVMVGDGPGTRKVYGVSSQSKWGAGRINPSARPLTHNDEEYKMLSFVESNPDVNQRNLKSISVGWFLGRPASGSRLECFRILPDYGGDDGMHGYTDIFENTVGVTSYPISEGSWDVGLYLDNTTDVVCFSVQSVGQWRMAGLLGIAHSKVNPAGFYKNSFTDCSFTGYRGVSIRSADGAPTVSNTANSVTIPWADDHPFGADGDMTFIAAAQVGQWANQGQLYRFTGMVKDSSGAYPVLRLTGVTPDIVGTIRVIAPDYRGGGTSHTNFVRGEYSGFQHPSRQPCHTRGLGGYVNGVFDAPGCLIELSGMGMTEVEFLGVSLASIEEVAFHVHDCRTFSFDGYIEMNRGASGQSSRGGRVIMSPQPSANPYSKTGTAAAGTLAPIWIHRGSTLYDGTLDTRPAQPLTSQYFAWDAPGDDGFMQPFHLQMPFDPNLSASVAEGGAVLSTGPGGRAGIGRRLVAQPFQTESVNDIDWALYYQNSTDQMLVRKTMRPDTAGQAGVGEFGTGAFSQIVGQRHVSYSAEIASGDMAEFTPPIFGGLAYVNHQPSVNVPQWGLSGLIYFDQGRTPYAIKVAGGPNFDVVVAPVSGTTGTDGNVTVGIREGAIQVENRSATTATFTLTILG